MARDRRIPARQLIQEAQGMAEARFEAVGLEAVRERDLIRYTDSDGKVHEARVKTASYKAALNLGSPASVIVGVLTTEGLNRQEVLTAQSNVERWTGLSIPQQRVRELEDEIQARGELVGMRVRVTTPEGTRWARQIGDHDHELVQRQGLATVYPDSDAAYLASRQIEAAAQGNPREGVWQWQYEHMTEPVHERDLSQGRDGMSL